MSISDIVGIVVGLATIYFLWQANELSKRQNEIFRDQNAILARQEGSTLASATNPIPTPITGVRRYWPMLGMATLAICTWGAVGYDMYERHQPAPQTAVQPAKTGPLIKAWGGTNDCREVIDGTQLAKWHDQFNVALICGFADATVDRLEDERITVSAAFTIYSGDIEIVAPFSSPLQQFKNDLLEKARKGIPKGTSSATLFSVSVPVWNETVLLPKSSKPSDIRRLSDVPRYGGIVLANQPSVP